MGDKSVDTKVKLNPTRQRIIEEMRNNPNIIQERLSALIGIGIAAIDREQYFIFTQKWGN